MKSNKNLTWRGNEVKSSHVQLVQVAPFAPTLIQCSTTHVLPWWGVYVRFVLQIHLINKLIKERFVYGPRKSIPFILPNSSSAVQRMSCQGEGMQVAPVTPTLIQCSTTHVLPWRGDAGRSRHSHTHPVQYHACPAMERGYRSLPSLPHSSSAVPCMSCHGEGMQVAPVTPTLIQCSTTLGLVGRAGSFLQCIIYNGFYS